MLLADEISQDDVLGTTTLAASVRAAERFIVDQKAVNAVASIEGVLFAGDVVKVVLPFPRTWIEFVFQGDVTGRVGVLFEAAAGGIDSITAAIIYAANGNVRVVPFRMQLALSVPVTREMQVSVIEDEELVSLPALPDAESLAATSLGNALAMIAAICQPAIATIDSDDRARLNRSRAAKGKPPLLSYKICKIVLPRLASQENFRLDAEPRAGLKVHLVRGHLRRTPTGQIIAIRSYERGDLDAGAAMKEYRLTGRSEPKSNL